MSEGTELLAEGTPVHLAGGRVEHMRFTMLSLVKLEEQFGGIGAVANLLPSGEVDTKNLPKTMFTDIMRLVHLGFLHKGWTFEETCSQLVPKYFTEYAEALGKELDFGGDKGAPKLQPQP